MARGRCAIVLLGLWGCTGGNTEEISRNSRVADAGRRADAEAADDADTSDPSDADEANPDEAGTDASESQADDASMSGATTDASVSDATSAPSDAGRADGSLDAQTGSGDAGQSDADAGPQCVPISHVSPAPLPTAYVLRVYDSVSNSALVGAHVVALDGESGEPMVPAREGDSDTRGEVRFADMPNDKSFGFKVASIPGRTMDTYQFGYTTDPENPDGAGLYAYQATRDQFAAQTGGFTLRPDAGMIVGFVQWEGPDTLGQHGVGCVNVSSAGLDDVRYQSTTGSQPRPATERAPSQGTFLGSAGGFYIGNAAPGKHVINAVLPDGTVIGSTTVFAYPRSAAGNQQGNMVIAQIHLDLCRDPTPASCQ